MSAVENKMNTEVNTEMMTETITEQIVQPPKTKKPKIVKKKVEETKKPLPLIEDDEYDGDDLFAALVAEANK